MKIKKLLGLALAAALFMAGIPDVVEAQRQVRVFTGGATAPTGTLDGDIWIDNSGNVSILTFGSFRRVGSRSSGSAVATVATTDANAIAAVAAVNSGVAAVGTLTVDTQPSPGIASAGTLSIPVQPANTETFTIDSHVYTFQTSLTEADCNILIGANAAATQVNANFAILAVGGTPGTDYASACVTHTTVTSAVFAGDDSVITAITLGTAGDALATTETMGGAGNQFDAATLGTTTAGVDADTYTIDTVTYTLRSTIDELSCNVLIGAANSNTQTNIVNAITATAGTPGTDYSSACVVHPTVTSGSFAADVLTLTAINTGLLGDAIVSTETFATGSNVFNATTLGGTTAGVNSDFGTLVIALLNELRTDYGTAITLINENKAQLNALLTQLRNAQIINQ